MRPIPRCVCAAAAAMTVAAGAHAGDLNAAVNSMFNDLGTIGNYTAPGAFKGQVFNTYSGGSFMLRSQNKTYQLMAISFPTMKAGCGGIDAFGGSFSHISATEFKNMLKGITAALPGVAFQLALESVSPLLGGVTKWTKNLESMLTNANINTCNTAKSLVNSAMEATGVSTDKVCEDLAVTLGLESDYAAARVRCQTDKPSVLASARGSSDPLVRNKAPFVGNLTWKALKLAGTNLDDLERELIMSLVGTVVFPDDGSDPQPYAPTITSISRLLYGSADASSGKVVQEILRCSDYVDCASVSVDAHYQHTPFTLKVETLMRSIANKILSRSPIPNNSAEVGFVNQTTEPVYRMLSVATAVPSIDLSEQMIGRFRDLIATDYAYVFLEKHLRQGIHALDKDYLLDSQQLERARELRRRAQELLAQLSREKSLIHQRVGSINAIATAVEQVERQMRSSMPQHVLDMLGRRAAWMK